MARILQKNEIIMNIKQKQIQNLSQQDFAEINSGTVSDKTTDKIMEVFNNPMNQFKFSNGKFMANENYNINNSFGIRYHINKSDNIEEFLKSVEIVIGSLSDSDIEKLVKVFNNIKNQ